jgi:hypothetical protein
MGARQSCVLQVQIRGWLNIKDRLLPPATFRGNAWIKTLFQLLYISTLEGTEW